MTANDEDLSGLPEILVELEQQHRDLDTRITAELSAEVVDEFLIQRLKRKKLKLKDRIEKLHALIQPDIIA